MPNIKSAKKRVLVIDRRTLENKRINSSLKTTIKKFNIALQEKNFALAEELLPTTISAIDSACSKGIMHKNKAARKKAQMYGNLTIAKKIAETVVEEKAPSKKAAKKAETAKAVATKTEEVKAPAKKPAAKKPAAKTADGETKAPAKKPAAKKAPAKKTEEENN